MILLGFVGPAPPTLGLVLVGLESASEWMLHTGLVGFVGLLGLLFIRSARVVFFGFVCHPEKHPQQACRGSRCYPGNHHLVPYWWPVLVPAGLVTRWIIHPYDAGVLGTRLHDEDGQPDSRTF